jgi:hypothetical protein
VRDVAGHTAADFMCLSVVLEVGMIGKDKDFVLGPKEEVAPVFQSSNNGEEFSVIDVVAMLRFVEGL